MTVTAAATLSLAAGSPWRAAAAQGGDPTAPVRALYDALLEAMKRGRELGIKGRYDQLAPTIARSFDVAGMTRFACGPGWEQATAAQRTALADAFAHMMTANYANRFANFNGQKFEIVTTVDQPPAGKLVKTRLTPAQAEPIALDYVMRSVGGAWKIADVYLKGTISELGIRRGEFVSVIRSGGPDALVESLRRKAEQFLAGA